MKNNHTHLTRLAAISLVLMLCLSVVPFMAPSASAAEDVTPLGTSGGGRGYVAITFDDGLREIYDNAAPVMEAAGIPGTAFITTDWIGSTSSGGRPVMTAEEILDLQDRGWEIGSHGVSHAKLSEIPYEDAVDELVNSKAALESIGIDCTSFAFPHSAGNVATYDAAWDTYERLRSGTVHVRTTTSTAQQSDSWSRRNGSTRRSRPMESVCSFITNATRMDTCVRISIYGTWWTTWSRSVTRACRS